MRAVVKFSTALLLLINGAGALYGGYRFLSSPDGSAMHLSPDILRHTPFHDFFVPGLILFIANGMLSFVVLAILLIKKESSPLLVVAQGSILTGWIVIQMFLLRQIVALHIVMGAIGILLILMGYLLGHINNSRRLFLV